MRRFEFCSYVSLFEDFVCIKIYIWWANLFHMSCSIYKYRTRYFLGSIVSYDNCTQKHISPPQILSKRKIDRISSQCYYKWQLNRIHRLSVTNFDRNWWRIVNPVKIRDGTATVCVEAPHATKVSHWEQSWEDSAESLWYASQETCLNVFAVYLFSIYGEINILLCRKSAAAVLRLPQFFVL